MESAKDYFGIDFCEKIYEIFESAEQEGKFIFVHGTYTSNDAINTILNGLECDYPELLYTAELMNRNDKLLFEKLKNWPHWDLKYLLMICVSKDSGKGGIPIWNQDLNGIFRLPPELIKGIIDVNQKLILPNPKYNSLENIKATIEDRSFETKTGKCIGISLPPDELSLYENNVKEERD